MDIVLASHSPRRRELLARMGLEFRTLSPDVDESSLQGLPPARLVEGLSLLKARAAAQRVGSQALIIAADTVVELDGAVLGKPKGEADAVRMLTALSGRCHRVYTGVSICREEKVLTAHEVTSVFFRSLREEEIGAYVATGEPMDKAGAYGIQGFGALLVERIEGDFYNVMGLPVCRLGGMLEEMGVRCLPAPEAEKQES